MKIVIIISNQICLGISWGRMYIERYPYFCLDFLFISFQIILQYKWNRK